MAPRALAHAGAKNVFRGPADSSASGAFVPGYVSTGVVVLIVRRARTRGEDANLRARKILAPECARARGACAISPGIR